MSLDMLGAVCIGADPTKKMVQKFQGGIISLPKAKMVPEFIALKKAIVEQTNAFGAYGAVTKAAATTFNSMYGRPELGDSITQVTLDLLKDVSRDVNRAMDKAENAATASEVVGPQLDQMVADKAAFDKLEAEKAAAVAAAKLEADKAAAATAAAKAATTPPQVQAAATQSVTVATNVEAAAPTPTLKEEAKVAKTELQEAKKELEAAKTPAEQSTAIEKVKDKVEAVENVAKKSEKAAGGSFLDWFMAKTIIPPAPNVVLVAGGIGVVGIIWWFATRKVAAVATAAVGG